MLLVTLAQATQDFDGVVDGRLAHIHRLETALQGGVPFDVLAVLVEGGGTDALQLTAGEGRLEDVGGVDRPLSSTGTDQGVHLVDHEDHVSGRLDLLHDLLEALFELTSVLGAGHQQTDIQGQDALVFKDVGNVALLNALGQTFSDGGLTDTGLADQNGIVLGAATQDLDDAIDFVVTTHHRVELGFGGELGEVVAELVEGGGFGGSLGTASTAAGGDFSGFTEHADHLGAHLGQVDAKVLQHTGSNTFALTDQTEQQVLCADVVVTELTGLFQRQLQDALGAGCEGDLNSDKAGSTADDFLNFNPGILEVDPHGLEHLGGNPRSLANQAEEDLFGTDEVVTKSAGLFLGQHDHLDGLLGEAFKHRWANAVM